MNLAYRLRPQTFSEFIGQSHIVGEGKIISNMLAHKQLFSMIFWGPPGSGKTTLAYLIAKESDAAFYHLSGVESGKAELKEILGKILDKPGLKAQDDKGGVQDDKKKGKRSILFIDEIHRWNKAQQDSLLPYVENGDLILIGATTENPSFEVNGALLSRCKVFVLNSLSFAELVSIVDHALSDETNGLGKYKKIMTQDAKELMIRLSGGDARILLNALEIAATGYKEKEISVALVQDIFQTKSAGLYDKKAEEHYNIISAFIKSMRGSSVDGALYYLARMLEGGEDPKFIARRMIIFASEDIGLADRGALIQANAGFEAVHKIGMPEAQLILAHIAVYLARAPKSRAVINALMKAKKTVTDFPNEPVPLHLRNAPTKLMKNLGYAKNYTWGEDYVGPTKDLSFLPEKLKDKKFWDQ